MTVLKLFLSKILKEISLLEEDIMKTPLYTHIIMRKS
jgi:hypothetical protein